MSTFFFYYAGFHDLSNLEDLRLDGSPNMENEFFKSIGN